MSSKPHAPRDVFEEADGSYRCGVCRAEVARYSAPRATWLHKEEPSSEELHRDGCPRSGFRYGATRPDGRVVMFCRDPRCPARRIV